MRCTRIPSIVLWMESKLWPGMQSGDGADPSRSSRSRRTSDPQTNRGQNEASRERTVKSAWRGKHRRKTPRDLQTGRSMRTCLSREVPTDHETRGQRSGGCGGVETTQLWRKCTPEAKGRTPSASGREQESHVNAKQGGGKQSGAGQTWKPHAAREGTCVSEQFATKQLLERHESVVQGATERREQREVPGSFEKHQSEEELKRADT